jgi:hypothetical protein
MCPRNFQWSNGFRQTARKGTQTRPETEKTVGEDNRGLKCLYTPEIGNALVNRKYSPDRIPYHMMNQAVLILDCISDHEIQKSLATEGEILRSIIANRESDQGPAIYKFATAKQFAKWIPETNPQIRYVHICAHANDKQLGFIKGGVSWRDVAKKLVQICGKLGNGERRVVCLSCCYSSDAVKLISPIIFEHYTGIYHHAADVVDFDKSITMWSMFYLKKPLDRPQAHRGIRRSINAFLADDDETEPLKFDPVRNHSRNGIKRHSKQTKIMEIE